MKKLFISLLVIVSMVYTSNLYSQNAYFTLSSGSAFNLGARSIDEFGLYNFTLENSTATTEQIYMSFGSGFNVKGTFGYMFTENIGADLGISYLLGKKYDSEENWDVVPDYGISLSVSRTMYARMLRFNPSIVFLADFEPFTPYAKFGFILGMGSITYEEKYIVDINIFESTDVLKQGLAIGFSSAIGLNLKLSDYLSVFGELEMFNLSYGPEKGERTKYKENGFDALSYLTTSEKEILFVDKATENINDTQSANEPTREMKSMYPFGSIGINIGLRVDF